MLSESEWSALHGSLLRFLKHRGDFCRDHKEDIAQDVLMALHIFLSKGHEVLDPLNWCRIAAMHRASRLLQREKKYIQLPDTVNEEGEERPSILLDLRDPADIVSAMEQLALCPEDLKASPDRTNLTSTQRSTFARLRAQVRLVIDEININVKKKREAG